VEFNVSSKFVPIRNASGRNRFIIPKQKKNNVIKYLILKNKFYLFNIKYLKLNYNYIKFKLEYQIIIDKSERFIKHVS